MTNKQKEIIAQRVWDRQEDAERADKALREEEAQYYNDQLADL